MQKFYFILISIIIFSFNSLLAQCPRGIDNCKGQCGRFVDENKDSYCDLTVITEKKEIIKKDTIKKEVNIKKIEKI